MSVMANGWGSRDKARVALRRIQQVPKQEENTTTDGAVQSDEEAAEPTSLPGSSDAQQSSGSKKPIEKSGTFMSFLFHLCYYSFKVMPSYYMKCYNYQPS